MSETLFLLRELLGRIRKRSALYLSLSCLFLLFFLASFATFFLFGSAPAANPEAENELAAGEVVIRLSPRLSAAAIDSLYLQIRERSDVARINFQFARETNPDDTGGRLLVEATSPAAVSTLVSDVEPLTGVTDVAWGTEVPVEGIVLSTGVRIGLLCGLVLWISLSLITARVGFRILLESFAGEVRLLRLSGLSERQILPPVVGLGVLLGLLSGLLLVVGLVLLRFSLGPAGADGAEAFTAFTAVGRTLGIGFGSLFLGVLIGGLIGLFGASILSTREYAPLP